uniref:Uncharacterized protein n=1 Tax=Eutreptiella gymnastica TaxID=73025 RepID=A0A7S4G9B7_9EUGL
MAAAAPSQCGNTAFKQWCHRTACNQWCHCLCNACMPLECCSTASQHCSTANGLQQHCLWTAAALSSDSDTAFLLRQHCLQLVAALPSHGSGSQRLHNVAALPSNSGATASVMLHAFGMLQHCIPALQHYP